MTGRVIPAATNWALLLKQTAPKDKKLMAAFKVKSDIIAANYGKAKQFNRSIDWAYYEKNVEDKNLVADFKAKFEAVVIPEPTDGGTEAVLEAKAAEDALAVEKYLEKVDGQIADASVTLNNINALPPFEQMTREDILYWFPQLCRNQEWVKFSTENDPANHIMGGTVEEVGYGNTVAWTPEMEADNAQLIEDNHWRSLESQYPGGVYPAFFSSFPEAEFRESFCQADPLIQWEQLQHHPQFDVVVNQIQAEEGAEPGFRDTSDLAYNG
jgi:hypothetical protein